MVFSMTETITTIKLGIILYLEISIDRYPCFLFYKINMTNMHVRQMD